MQFLDSLNPLELFGSSKTPPENALLILRNTFATQWCTFAISVTRQPIFLSGWEPKVCILLNSCNLIFEMCTIFLASVYISIKLI